MVQCNVDDNESIKNAVAGAHTVFATTNTSTSSNPSHKTDTD